MDWKKLTLSQIRRLVAAIEQASDGREVISSIIERTADEPMPHGRVTMESLINLLEQLDGCTVLSDEALAAIKQLDESPTAGTPEVVTAAGDNNESDLTAPFCVFVNGDLTAASLIVAGQYRVTSEDIGLLHEALSKEDSINQEMGLVHYTMGTSSGWAMANIELQRSGWRVATARELLAFGIAYPDQQTQYPIIALGTEFVKNGSRRASSLDRGYYKGVNLSQWDGNWDEACRFLVVKKTDTPRITKYNLDPLVATCQFNGVSEEFTAKHFPLVEDYTTGPVDEMTLWKMTALQAIVEIESRGYVPVGVRRGLEYIAANHRSLIDNPRQVAIVGARWLDRSPIVTLNYELMMQSIHEPYPGSCCYLVARPE